MSHFPTDPDENAASLVNVAELLFGCLDAAGARSVVEVGAFQGKSTSELLDWAAGSGAQRRSRSTRRRRARAARARRRAARSSS